MTLLLTARGYCIILIVLLKKRRRRRNEVRQRDDVVRGRVGIDEFCCRRLVFSHFGRLYRRRHGWCTRYVTHV